MSDNKLTDERGLYQVPDEPEPPPLQGSISAPVSAMGKASAPQEPSAAALVKANRLVALTINGDDTKTWGQITVMGNMVYSFGTKNNDAKESMKIAELCYKRWVRDVAYALDAFAAARVAEAVAAERERIVAALNELRSHYREDAERWTKENNWNAAALSDRFGNIVTGCINAIQEATP
jgi:hypothetical protein